MAFWAILAKLPLTKIINTISSLYGLIGNFKPNKIVQSDIKPAQQLDAKQISVMISRIDVLEENVSMIQDQTVKHNKGIEELIAQMVSLANATQRLSKRVTMLFFFVIILLVFILFLLFR